MPYNLRNRSFVKEIDFEAGEVRYLLQLAEALKLAKYAGTETYWDACTTASSIAAPARPMSRRSSSTPGSRSTTD
jgi:ornithine carbamoyltransferase